MISREGYTTILVVVVFSIVAGAAATLLPDLLSNMIYLALGILCLLTIYFFRDPDRNIPENNDSLLISPADGKIVLMKEIQEDEYVKDKVTQISIFLSPLNVHVNRVPLTGAIEYVKYSPGKYLMAWEDHASDLNERAHFGVLHPSGTKLLFKQITGFLARRIVYDLKEGDQVEAGERFGIMKFGSRMDLLVPDEFEINVKKGEKTVAGETIIGRLR